MNLSRLILNPQSRAARNDLASPYEMHRTLVTRGFPDGNSEGNRLLFRIEPPIRGVRQPGVAVIVQSSVDVPSWTHLPEDYCVRIDGPKEVGLLLHEGEHLGFRLTANPVVKRKRLDALRTNGHPKHQRFGLLREEEQQTWLIRKGKESGFDLLYVNAAPFRLGLGYHGNPTDKNKNSISHFGVRYDGLLVIRDVERLLEALRSGIGPAKAFGFGLLSLSPPIGR